MNQKAIEQIFRGIHYIRISPLPEEQKDQFVKWLPRDQIIKIQVEQDIYNDCVQFHHYEHWFDNIMRSQMNIESEPIEQLGISIQ